MKPVLVFDLDDTLYPEIDFVRSGFAAVDRWLSEKHGADRFLEVAWQAFEEGRRGDVFDVALSALGIEATPTLIRDMVGVYRDHLPTIELYPDAARLLARHADFPGFAIVTDGFEIAQRRKVEALELHRYCEPIIRTDGWGRAYWKPHLRAFVAIQEHFAQPGSSFVYLADNPSKDFIGPRALGWKTVRVRRPLGFHKDAVAKEAEEADVTIENLDHLSRPDVAAFVGTGR